MKRLFSILIVLLTMITILGIYGNAEEAGTEASERTIMDVLVDAAVEQELQEKFFNEEMLPEEYVGYSIAGKPVLMVLCYPDFEWKADDVVGTFTKMWEDQSFAKMSFTIVESAPNREGIRTVSYIANREIYKDHERAGKLRFDSPYFSEHLETLLLEPAVQSFLGEEFAINNVIVCGTTGEMIKKVYFTDGGVFVRTGNGKSEYTWEDFVPYYNAYCEWCQEQRYNEDGELLFGGVTLSFDEFVNDIYPAWTPKMDSDIPQFTWMIWVGVSVLVCCVVAVVVVRKRKDVQDRQVTEITE